LFRLPLPYFCVMIRHAPQREASVSPAPPQRRTPYYERYSFPLFLRDWSQPCAPFLLQIQSDLVKTVLYAREVFFALPPGPPLRAWKVNHSLPSFGTRWLESTFSVRPFFFSSSLQYGRFSNELHFFLYPPTSPVFRTYFGFEVIARVVFFPTLSGLREPTSGG